MLVITVSVMLLAGVWVVQLEAAHGWWASLHQKPKSSAVFMPDTQRACEVCGLAAVDPMQPWMLCSSMCSDAAKLGCLCRVNLVHAVDIMCTSLREMALAKQVNQPVDGYGTGQQQGLLAASPPRLQHDWKDAAWAPSLAFATSTPWPRVDLRASTRGPSRGARRNLHARPLV